MAAKGPIKTPERADEDDIRESEMTADRNQRDCSILKVQCVGFSGKKKHTENK